MKGFDTELSVEVAKKAIERENSIKAEFYKDHNQDLKSFQNRLLTIIICLIISMSLMLGGFVFGYFIQQEKYLKMIQDQQEKYLNIIQEQQKDFIDFLNQYDFSSYQQDGEGENYINKDVGGDVYNGATP